AGLFINNSCINSVYEFEGFDRQLSGVIKDSKGDFVSGDIKSVAFSVNALGDFDQASMVLRINNDGTYANTKLFSQSYKIWLVGPFIESPTDPITIDLSGSEKITHDFQVTPFLTIPAPVL